jgi:hypothetical protein
MAYENERHSKDYQYFRKKWRDCAKNLESKGNCMKIKTSILTVRLELICAYSD